MNGIGSDRRFYKRLYHGWIRQAWGYKIAGGRFTRVFLARRRRRLDYRSDYAIGIRGISIEDDSGEICW